MLKKKGKKGRKGKSKGKKEGKQESKGERESEIERAKANAALWETRLGITESSRLEYREAARRLARANEELTNQQYRAEKETVDIIAFLKKKEAEKEAKIAELEEELHHEKTKALEEKEQIVGEYTQTISDMEDKFKKRLSEFRMIQGELKTIKEFRKQKAHMEQELTNLKENMYIENREHKEMLARVEHKFFIEKVRLEKEAEQRIAQLAERAHNEAVVQLDDASCSVFKENMRLNEALTYHMSEVEHLRGRSEILEEENASLTLHKDTSEFMMKQNVCKMAAQKKEILQLRSKVDVLERALNIMSVQFEHEKNEIQEKVILSTQTNCAELEKLQKLLALRECEMTRVKRLARIILEQRTELELFLHGALEHVKQEILSNRLQYRQEALDAYQRRMSDARAGRQEYPHIRTFHRKPYSTNSVFADLEEAEKWTNMQSTKVDIAELTWEQKEKVLRLLFAKMNSLKYRKPAQTLKALSEQDQSNSAPGIADDFSHHTFITQAPVPNQTSDLPDLHTS
ncbi:basal body-orientation factor 1 [Alosa sapidissima]|uniref:basal body-orientation factor 1 n=1 Tax=Alosa sapidissima TaxID=34773 RepID=UPI001C0A0424|nr:basal body-orientation factor 1 [Alosa sapidissima]